MFEGIVISVCAVGVGLLAIGMVTSGAPVWMAAAIVVAAWVCGSMTAHL